MMVNDYPTDDELYEIETYDTVKDGVKGLVELVQALWIYPDYFKLKGKRTMYLELHTGGWSGHEDVIYYLKKNYLFWSLSWRMSKAGGHYYFKLSHGHGKNRMNPEQEKKNTQTRPEANN